MAKVLTPGPMEQITSVNSKIIRCMAKVLVPGLVDQSTSVPGKVIKGCMVLIPPLMAINTLESIKMTNIMGKVHLLTVMERFNLGFGIVISF